MEIFPYNRAFIATFFASCEIGCHPPKDYGEK